MTPGSKTVALRAVMDAGEGWGRAAGRVAFASLQGAVAAHPGHSIIRVSLKDVRRMDVPFASETLCELTRRCLRHTGVYLVDVDDEDVVSNIDAAAARMNLPLNVWTRGGPRIIGLQPDSGTAFPLRAVLSRSEVTAVQLCGASPDLSIANASGKLRRLWKQGFVLRRQDAAASGGKEFTYFKIG